MQNKQPLVSVIMNCYNSDKYLKEAINSVLAQTYQNWEIIFWDNQSTDKSAEIVKSYNDKRIKYFYAPSHTSLGEGRNEALEKAQGEFISFLDCDDLLSSDKIEKQVEVLFNNSDIGFVYTNGARIDEKSQIRTVFYKGDMPSGNIFREALENYDFYIPSVMFKKDIVLEHNIVFDVAYSYIEEYDFFLKILKFTKAKYLKEKLSYWRVHSNSNTWKNYENFIYERTYFLNSFFNEQDSITYVKEIKSIENLNTFQKSLLFWKSGENKEARKELFPIVFYKLKYFLVYFMEFIDFKFMKLIISKFKYIK